MEQLISVVIPVYNAEKTIEDAIRSVITQSWKNVEILVVDDCSTDESPAILNSLAYEDARIRIFRNKENCGVSATRNYGVREAKGEFVAFLDSDDVWLPHKLERQAAFLKDEPGIDMIYTSYGYMTANGFPYRHQFLVPVSTNANKMLKQNVMSTSGLMIRRKLLIEHPFQKKVAHEDLYEWITLLEHGARCVGLQESLHVVRLTGSSSRSGNKIRSASNRMDLFRQFGLGFFQRYYYWVCYSFFAVIKYLSLLIGGVEKEKRVI